MNAVNKEKISLPHRAQIAGGIVLALFSAVMILYHASLPTEPDTPAAEHTAAETESVEEETDPDPNGGSDAIESETDTQTEAEPAPVNLASLAAAAEQINPDPSVPLGMITEELLAALPEDKLRALEVYFSENPAPSAAELRKMFYQLTGATPLAYADMLAAGTFPNPVPADTSDIASLVFTGDFSLGRDFSWCPINHLGDSPTVSDFIIPPLDGLLSGADLTCVNLECTISDRGTPTPNKTYTFRADPADVRILTDLGVDIVSLANNHVYDYGADALLDTLTHLTDAAISYVGAGADIKEAAYYKTVVVNGLKIGFAAASNAEKFYMTPLAGESTPGILAMYDPAMMLETIESASADCDYVIAVVHWGTENSTVVNDNQRELTAQFIEAGADAIIGHHPHVLQETAVVDGVPVAYSLGNFWFNTSPNETAAAQLELSWANDGTIASELIMHPCSHDSGITRLTE